MIVQNRDIGRLGSAVRSDGKPMGGVFDLSVVHVCCMQGAGSG